MDKLVSKIGNILNNFLEQLETYLPALEREVTQIIEEKSINSQQIENYLDTLLSLCQHGIGNDLYIKLLEYYKTVNTAGAQFYWKEYDNLEN